MTVNEDAPRDGYFLEMKKENFAAYDRDIADAVRTGDLDAVKKHVAEGKTLQCCNKFSESVVHIVCRRGHKKIPQKDRGAHTTNIQPHYNF